MSSTDQQKEAILTALRRVVEPGSGRDVVSLGFVKNLAVSDGVVRVTYELPADLMSDASQQALSEMSRAAILEMPDFQEASVDFTRQPDPRVTSNLPGVKHVIAVGAGKGGVGKSTVALLLAVGLHRQGSRVGLLDADVYGPSLPKLTGTEEVHPTVNQDTGQIYPPEFSGIKIMSMGHIVAPDQAVVWRGPMAQKYVKEFLDRGIWGELDYLIVDLPPGTGDIPLTLAQAIPLTGAVVVCTPQDVALLDATKAIRMYQKLGVDPLGMVENMSYFHCPSCGERAEIFGHGGARHEAARMKVPFLGEIPLNISIRINSDQGKPLDHFTTGDAAVVGSIEQVVNNLVEQVVLHEKQGTPLPQLRVSG
jgi:ATP-binding protein involved in chromosome partitioning